MNDNIKLPLITDDFRELVHYNPITDDIVDAVQELMREAVRLNVAVPDKQHPDDVAVDAFAAAMKAKLAKKRSEGRDGWQECRAEYLSDLLRSHVEKGDPVDVANLAMMLHQNGQGITPAEPVSKAYWNNELSSWSDEDFIRIFHECPDLANRLQKILAEPSSVEDAVTWQELESFRKRHWEHWNASDNLLIAHLVQTLRTQQITTPAASQPLTDEQIEDIADDVGYACVIAHGNLGREVIWFDGDLSSFARAIERAHGIGVNND